MVKSRGGRPTNVTIADDYVTIIRKALKATVRYYGIRLQDLGPESWIAHAMRTKASMSVETASSLIAYTRPPTPTSSAKNVLRDRQRRKHSNDLWNSVGARKMRRGNFQRR